MSIKFTIMILISLLITISCRNTSNKYVHLKIDLSKEHDALRFLPEKGDYMSIAGNFNGWTRDKDILVDDDGDWIFEINYSLAELNLAKKAMTSDSLDFKFLITAGDQRELANQGWEQIPNRKMPIYYIQENNPVFTYNQIFEDCYETQITFTIVTSNQQVLGHFIPDKGDKIAITGSFCDWDESGFLLFDDDEDGIYNVTLGLCLKLHETIEYKYRLLPGDRDLIKRPLINSGWETIPNRKINNNGKSITASYAEFSDLRRVVRFVVNTSEMEMLNKFNPLKGDILQIRLILDGKENFSDPLLQVNTNNYETAFTISLRTRVIKYQLVKNFEEKITELGLVEVPLIGKKL